MTVRMTLVLFLLWSGFYHFIFASNHLRLFRLPQTIRDTFSVSLNECNETYESFVTLYDEEDASFTNQFMDNYNYNYNYQIVWLGLSKLRNITWSDGRPVTFSRSSVTLGNNEQICEGIENGTWKGFNCSERKPFMCYRGKNYTLIKNEKKNWCQALQHCRKHYTNLVSISDGEQNAEVIKKGNDTSFWIGLLHDEWEWKDNGCSSFRKWHHNGGGGNTQKEECTTFDRRSPPESLYKFGCDSIAHSYCSNGTMRIKVINRSLTWEEAYNYCKAHHTGQLWIENEQDQHAVEQWLNYTDVGGPFWIGLRQSRVFGFWIWSDRTVYYNNWKNDTVPELPMSNHCGVISKPDYKWSDENCLMKLPFLCEEEIVFMSRSTGG